MNFAQCRVTIRKKGGQIEFIFKPGKIGKGYTEEIASILAKMTEIASRQKMPAIWDKIDKLNRNKVPEDVLIKRKKRHLFYGIILIAVGFFLFVPGLLKPKELFVPLIVGAFSMVNGFFAVLPRRNSEERFEKSAKKLIRQVDSFSEEKTVIFDDKSISENGFIIIMDYADIKEFFESGNFIFISDGKKVLVFRKCDLVSGSLEDLVRYINEKADADMIFLKFNRNC